MSDFIAKFQQDFIESDRYLYLLRGLGNTLLIAALAVILGIVLGFLVSHTAGTRPGSPRRTFRRWPAVRPRSR